MVPCTSAAPLLRSICATRSNTVQTDMVNTGIWSESQEIYDQTYAGKVGMCLLLVGHFKEAWGEGSGPCAE